MILQPTLKQRHEPDLPALLAALKQDIMKSINCVRIGVIQSFNAADQTVTVKIAQQQITSVSATGVRTIAEYPLLVQVPVQFPSGGGFTLTFPIAAGDECLVLFNDRELDNWFFSGAGKEPTTARLHDLSDGIAIVGIRNNTRSLAGVSAATTQLRSDDGTTYVEIASGGIVNIVAPTGCNIVGNVILTGNLGVSGEITDENGNHSLSTHIHGGVTTGSGNTGAPIG